MEHNPNPDFIKLTIRIPEDEYDEDDEMDERIEEMERNRKNRVVRGDFFGI